MKKSYSSTILKSTLLLLIFTMAAGMLQSCSSVYDTQRSESKQEMIKNGENRENRGPIGSMGSLLGA